MTYDSDDLNAILDDIVCSDVSISAN